MEENKIKCEVCGTLNSIESVKCENCGKELQNDKFEKDQHAILKALQQISGVGSSRAKNIVNAGYSDVDDLHDIDIESISSIKGIGESVANDIVSTIEETKEKGGLYLCDECGAFVGEESEHCSNCGAVMVDVDEEAEPELEEIDEEVGDEHDKQDSSLYLCSNCGSFVSADSDICKYCGASMDVVEEDVDDEPPIEPEENIADEVEEEEEDDGLFLCTNCGAFVSVKSTECPSCGFTFTDEIEEEVDEEVVKEIKPEVKDEELIDEDIIYEVDEDEVEIGDEGPQKEFDEEIEWETDDIESQFSEEEIEPFEGETIIEDESEIESESKPSTSDALSIGDDVKICGNCGYISDSSVDTCPLCDYEFGEKTVEAHAEVSDLTEVEKDSLKDDVDTMRKALGLSDEIKEESKVDERDVLSRDDNQINVCTVCGAFLREESERCHICGSLSSETPELDEIEEEPHIDYTDGEFSICDACGAFVKDGKKSCSICGSDMALAQKKIENEEVSVKDENQEKILEDFFGQGVEDSPSLTEKDEEVEIYLCTSCGAMVSSEADICPICQSYLGEGETREEYELQEIEEDVDSVTTTSEEFEKDSFEEEDFDLNETEIDKELGLEQEIEEDLEDPKLISEETDLGTDEDEFDVKLNEEIESILKSRYDEEEKEEISEQSYEDSEIEDNELEQTPEELQIKSDTQFEKKKYEETKEEDEWQRCPICKSHVSADSEYCSICEQPLDGKITKSEKFTASNVSQDTKEIRSERPVLSKAKPTVKSTRQKSDFIESHLQESMKNILYKAKDYQVPVSSLSLLAFGGIYLTTYRTSDFTYFGEFGLILISLFFGLGVLTILTFKDEIISYSILGFVGYVVGIVISSLVPILRYMIRIEIPLLVSAGLIATALGMFWILDYKLPKKFHYYMLWFSGISILFVAGLTIIIYPVQLSHLEYTILLPLGLGSVMILGGTATWYKEANEVYENSVHLKTNKMYNYRKSGYFEDVRKTCPVSEEKAIPYYSKGIASCSMGEYNDAIKKFKKALEIEGDNEAIWNNLGTAYSRVGEQERAKKCLTNAIEIKEEYAIAWNNLGNSNFRCGNYSEALECYDKALQIQEDYRDAMLNKSQALIKLSRIKA
ncbi:MAG: double zinc ribbon domain-containing protein [Thermoplasmatota archaeon]